MTPGRWRAYGITTALIATMLVLPLADPAFADPTDTQGGGRAHAGAVPGSTSTQPRTNNNQPSAAGAADNYPVRGIDVSSHDHATYGVDWPAQAASGVKFAYIKATEGTTYTNPYFASDYQAARAAGLYVGAYTFARPDKDAIATADFFVDQSQWTPDAKTIIPMVDLEWPYFTTVNSCYNLTTTQMSTWIRSFVGRVESRIGRKPMIYTNANWWNPCTGSDASFGEYPLNIASYTSTLPVLPAGWSTFTMWQYAAGNTGVAGNHDKDVFNGDLPGLATLAGPTAASVISLRAHANGSFVTTGGGTSPLVANRGFVGAWEKFDVIDPNAGQTSTETPGYVALRSQANGRYVSAESGGASPLSATRLVIGDWEKFQIVSNPDDGSISLKAAANGAYVSADKGGAAPLIANRATVGDWERFDSVTTGTVINLRARVNSRYVTAESGGAAPLIARGTTVGLWEQYEKIDLHNGWIALRSQANGKYVTAENGGASALIARGTALGLWEMFQIVDNGDGSIALKAAANGAYVSADGGGASPLIANRAAVGDWERFDLS